PDEVFVFTPRGEVINLPRRASTVDFAYAIHSEVGDHCAGARVNGKMVPLRQVLVDGDTVEITTNERQFPRKDWLEFVVSGKARSRVRHAIQASERARSVELGRDIVSREFKKAGLSLSKLTQSGEMDDLAISEAKGGGVDDLFAAVSYGKLSAALLVRKLKGEEPPEPQEPLQDKILGLFKKRPNREPDAQNGVLVGGMSDVMVRFGGCCDPLPGDDVVGFVTRGRGVTVHGRNCRRVFEVDPARRVDVEWDTSHAVPRKVKIQVDSQNRPGILSKVVNSISAANINIAGLKVTTDDEQGRASQAFELWVNDTKTLTAVMKEIGRIKGVTAVERVRG
ncbi:TGS domain-containing protein, partial [Myxococcota bacterium]|nr:TGS domain-containing protein [Myxococcota bacterium]